jgi:hypothetical protein
MRFHPRNNVACSEKNRKAGDDPKPAIACLKCVA